MYSFCEFIFATSTSYWHIRKLSDKGPKYGGGIDTPSLCGRKASGWDLEVKINKEQLSERICPKCKEKYLNEEE